MIVLLFPVVTVFRCKGNANNDKCQAKAYKTFTCKQHFPFTDLATMALPFAVIHENRNFACLIGRSTTMAWRNTWNALPARIK